MAESDTLIDCREFSTSGCWPSALKCLERLDVPPEDAAITAEVLLSADLRGVDSHGVARFPRYVNGLRNGVMLPDAAVRTLAETRGHRRHRRTGRARTAGRQACAWSWPSGRPAHAGVGFVTVRNSNHYGIAGYYAMMALAARHDRHLA